MGKLLMDYEHLYLQTEKRLATVGNIQIKETSDIKDLKYFQNILDTLEELADLKYRLNKVNQYLERIRLVSK